MNGKKAKLPFQKCINFFSTTIITEVMIKTVPQNLEFKVHEDIEDPGSHFCAFFTINLIKKNTILDCSILAQSSSCFQHMPHTNIH